MPLFVIRYLLVTAHHKQQTNNQQPARNISTQQPTTNFDNFQTKSHNHQLIDSFL